MTFHVPRFWICAALVAGLAPLSTLAAEAKKTAAPTKPPIGEPRVYKRVVDRELRIYVVKPEGWKPTDQRPDLVLFHGGGWVGGTPGALNEQAQYLASRGMVILLVEYRLVTPRTKMLPTNCVADAKSAMRWARSHASELGIDPARLGAGGGSAGGHLAAFTALVPGLDDPQDDLKVSPRPAALVLFNPVFDNGPGEWGHDRVGDRYQEFSTAHHIGSNAPPTIVFLGTQDELVRVETVKRYQGAMRAVGARCDTHYYEGQPHGFYNRQPYRTLTLIETDKFLAALGWLTGPPTLTPPPP